MHYLFFLLFVIVFNPSNIYVLLHRALTYGTSSIFLYLCYCIRSFVWLFLFFDFFNCNLVLFHVLYNCAVFFNCFCLLDFLRILKYSQSTMKGVYFIISRPNKICTGVVCDVFWYVLRDEKSVAARIPYQGSSLYR